MKGVSYDETDPNYDLLTLAARSLVQRLYPTICNVEWSGRKGFDRTNPAEYNATMGKRNLAHVKSFEPRPRVSQLMCG